jgi:hypothetical protein
MAVVLCRSEARMATTGLTPVLPAGAGVASLVRDPNAAAELARIGVLVVEDVRRRDAPDLTTVSAATRDLFERLRTAADLMTDLPEELLACRYRELLSPPPPVAGWLAEMGVETLRDAVIASRDPRPAGGGEAGAAGPQWLVHQLLLLPACAAPNHVNLFARPWTERPVVAGDDPVLAVRVQDLGLAPKGVASLLGKGIVTVRDLLTHAWSEQFARNLRTEIRIRARLADLGLTLETQVAGDLPGDPRPLVSEGVVEYFRDMVRRCGYAGLLEHALEGMRPQDECINNKCLCQTQAEVCDGLDNDCEGGVKRPAAGVPKRGLRTNPQAVASLLSHRPDVFRVAEGTYVHQRGLPLPVVRLREATDWCVQRLIDAGGVRGAAWLLSELEGAGRRPRQLTLSMLVWELRKRRDVASPSQGRFSSRTVFAPMPATPRLVERLRAISLAARGFLPADEFRARLEGSLSYSRHGVLNTLRHNAEFLLVSPYRFLHVAVLGRDAAGLEQLRATAFAALPADGSLAATSGLVAGVEAACGPLLPGSGEQAEILL